MLPDQFPIFHIDLDCDFQSSDNIYPSYNKNPRPPKQLTSNTIFSQSETTTIFSHIGERKDNLDRCVVLKLQSCQILALFDGHCDPHPVDYLQAQLPNRLAHHSQLLSNPLIALTEVFEELERQVIERYEKGSTALVAIITKNQIFAANLGDCKLMGVDSYGNIKNYTTVHNLSNSQQLKNVISRGGIVLKKGSQYRINGQLNLSRCFGDRNLKNSVSSTPDLYHFSLHECRRWVIASDGFYNAQNLDSRVKISSTKSLVDMTTHYRDNASAIFLDM